MYKKTITYTDYNGNERKEDHYFNLNKAELLRMEMSVKGGMVERLNRIIAAQDVPTLVEIFDDLIQRSYGVKTPDGHGFVKRKEDLEAFMASEAYSELCVELYTNSESAAAFINGIVPADVAKRAALEAGK